MESYKLYLENLLNALSRSGFLFPVKLETYEDLVITSEILSSFLEMNTLLQRAGEGFEVMGIDESTTFKSYWTSEFYIDYQERRLNELSYLPTENADISELESKEILEEELVNDIPVSEISDSIGDSLVVDSVEDNVYSSITGISSEGFDIYGVDLEDEDISSESDGIISESDGNYSIQEEDSPNNVSYNSLEGVSSSGFDYYGVDLDYEKDGTNESESSRGIEDSEDDLSSGFDDYGEELEEDSSTESKETVEPVKELSSEFDYYGDDLEEDESEDLLQTDKDEDYDPSSGEVVDLVPSYEEYEEDYDEDYDPSSGEVVDLVEQYNSSTYYEEDDDYDPSAGEVVDLVEQYNSYYEDDDFDPSAGEVVDLVEDYNSQSQEGVSELEENKPKPHVIPKELAQTKKVLDFFGKVERNILRKVKDENKK